jgi:hypothetical protein
VAVQIIGLSAAFATRNALGSGRATGNIFAIQDDVTTQIVAALAISLSGLAAGARVRAGPGTTREVVASYSFCRYGRVAS